jgi:uncharacterized membrane protein
MSFKTTSMGADGMVKNLDVKKDLLLSKSLIYAGYHSEGWWVVTDSNCGPTD